MIIFIRILPLMAIIKVFCEVYLQAVDEQKHFSPENHKYLDLKIIYYSFPGW